MEDISNNINIMFQNLFITKNEIHPFFIDIIRVKKIAEEYIYYQKKFIRNKINYQPHIDNIEGRVIIFSYKILKKKYLVELEKEMHNVMNWNKILKIVSNMSQYLLESSVKNEDNFYKKISQEDKLNIMIIGSGPVGLFLACYLHFYYNMSMGKNRRVNVVLYDNRIEKPGFKKPYNRHRPFSTSSTYFNLIIPKIYCWNENKDNLFINIFMLEYLLYTTATCHYNIPMIYEDYTIYDYKRIIKEGNFKVVFDCTGGRLKHNFIKNIDTTWLDKFKEYHNMKLNINTMENLVTIDYKSKKFKQNFYYGSLSIHSNNMKFVNKYDIDIKNEHDLLYINKFKHKMFSLKDINNIIPGIKDDTARNFLFSIMLEKNDMYKNMIFTLDCWSIYIRHVIKVSDIITVDDKKILYIGAGDTIFHSHFIVGAGLNRIIDFTVKCANIIYNI